MSPAKISKKITNLLYATEPDPKYKVMDQPNEMKGAVKIIRILHIE